MKQPLQALLIAGSSSQNKVEAGVKSISIRSGHRAYRVGEPIILCCQITCWCVKANVTEVRHTTLGEVTEQEYRDDGFGSQEELVAIMQKYYPGIGLNDQVTIVRWDNLEWGIEP